jgi:hypothetical protein
MAKRAAGEGSIFKRGKRWVGQVGSGENRETKYFDTQREARMHGVIKWLNRGDKVWCLLDQRCHYRNSWMSGWLWQNFSSTKYVSSIFSNCSSTYQSYAWEDIIERFRPDHVQSLYTQKLEWRKPKDNAHDSRCYSSVFESCPQAGVSCKKRFRFSYSSKGAAKRNEDT